MPQEESCRCVEDFVVGMFTEDLYDMFKGDFVDTWADEKFGISAQLRDHVMTDRAIVNVLYRISELVAISDPTHAEFVWGSQLEVTCLN